jgi:ABC-type bacteriocin/lantibiotic exporter with double-glycine peptidase domain
MSMRLTLACVTLLVTGCMTYTGSATTLAPQALREDPAWMQVPGVKPLRQKGEHDCGPTALAMVVNYWQPSRAGEPFQALPTGRQASAGELREAARARGLSAFVVEGKPEDLIHELQQGRPMIVGTVKQVVGDSVTHYEVVVGMHRESRRVATYDPAAGLTQNSFVDFLTEWEATGRVLLVIMPADSKPPTAPGQAGKEQDATAERSDLATRQ